MNTLTEEKVLRDDDYWIIKTFGPRYFTAVSKKQDEHRIYFSYDALERDFGKLI